MVNRHALFWGTAVGVVILDQLTKWFARMLSVGKTVSVIPGVFEFTHIQNSGAGFGILQGQNFIFMLVALAAIVIIVASLEKILEDHHTTWSSALILGGAAGNLIDRLAFQSVTDFLHFSFFPAFNVADSALTIGIVALIWMSFKEK
jgi:signal peptidase II